MHRSLARVGLLAAALPVLSGCGLLSSQSPSGHTPPPSTYAEPAPSTSKPVAPPPRPFEMRLNAVDPCEILTPGQRAQLGFDRDPLPDSEGGFGDAPTCSFRNTTAKVGARLSLITTEGMGVWTDDTAQVEATSVVLRGFPSLVIRTPDLDLSCNVAVDVAEGQHLDVLYRDDGARPAPPLDQLCSGARRVAEAAVASLAGPSEQRSSTPPTDSADPSARNG